MVGIVRNEEREDKMHSSSKKSSHHSHKRGRDSESEESEVEMKIHKKKENGFDRSHSNTADEDRTNSKLKELATDVKSQEAVERGAFENFDLPANLVAKLKAKGINYLYPIQVATLTHIRAGHDVIAQASNTISQFWSCLLKKKPSNLLYYSFSRNRNRQNSN